MQIPEAKGHYVYLLECENDTFYCGYTNDLHHRFHMHKQGKGAKYTRAFPPRRICYFETFQTMRDALKREYAIKQLSRKEKQALCVNLEENANCTHDNHK